MYFLSLILHVKVFFPLTLFWVFKFSSSLIFCSLKVIGLCIVLGGHLSYLMFSALLRSLVSCLTLIWRNSQALFRIFILPFFPLSAAAAAAKSLQSCPTLCDPIDGSPPGSPILRILKARTLEWVAIAFSNAWKWKVIEVDQSCPTLSNPMDCSPPGSSIHGIFQVRVLEWGAFSSFWFPIKHIFPLL